MFLQLIIVLLIRWGSTTSLDPSRLALSLTSNALYEPKEQLYVVYP